MIADDVKAQLLKRKPGAAVLASLQRLMHADAYLLEIDANERSISYRLAMYLQAEFANFDVDCEYNRDGVDPKRLQYLDIHPDQDDTEARTVFPDIIVHRRGGKDNYLVIEVKKSTSHVPRKIDHAKLRGYKRELGYQFSLFLEFETAGEPSVRLAEWF